MTDGLPIVVSPCTLRGRVSPLHVSTHPVTQLAAALATLAPDVPVYCAPCLLGCPDMVNSSVLAFDPEQVYAGVDVSGATSPSTALPIAYTLIMDPRLLPGLDLDASKSATSYVQLDVTASALERNLVPLQVAVERALATLSSTGTLFPATCALVACQQMLDFVDGIGLFPGANICVPPMTLMV